VFEDERIEEGFDDFLLARVELTHGLELEPEVLVGTATRYAQTT
jgi:hypothetical protein